MSLSPDSEVVLERNDGYWGEHARVKRLRFNIVPDTTTRALELRKGSADISFTSLTPDIINTLRQESNLKIIEQPGSSLQYLAFNLRDPILKDVRVRQALAYTIDRAPNTALHLRRFRTPELTAFFRRNTGPTTAR